jgi:class 3 adenylate cyclase/ketosteroid isomerase-like protein
VGCGACGRENRDDARFCAGCGAGIVRRCASCDRELAADARFCDGCGAPVEVAEQELVPAGDRKIVSILFADLSGSTSLQERLDAEATSRLMARVQQVLSGAVVEHGGRVVKSTGDGLMAVFGIPVLREDDAVRAVRAGIAMQAEFASLALTDVALRVGVNTGEVVVSPDTDDVVGDPVNVAARLEAAAALGDVLVGPETQRLVRDVITLEAVEPLTLKGKAEPVAAARVVSDAQAAVVTTTTPFLGREHDLDALLSALDDAIASSAARLVTVVGWPGLGKSRLAAELCARVADRAVLVEARFVADGGTSFGPIADALRQVVDPDALDLGEDRERVVETLQSLSGSTEQVFWAIRRTLEAMAASSPVVVVLDDVHWAEPAMLDLVEHLAEWLRGGPVVLLALARPELREQRPSLLDATGPSSAVVVLTGLSVDASRQLALEVLETDELPEGVLRRALDASEGNPLFLRELLRLLVDDRVLVRDGDAWRLTVEVDAIQLPSTIHAALAARIEQLHPDERAVLQAASVIGRHFARGAVGILLPASVSSRLDEHLASLHRRALVDPEGTWWADERMFRFHHVLIRDAAYRRVLKEVRADQHVRYADWLAEREGDDDVLGYHLEQAIEYRRELGERVEASLIERAARHLSVAGRRALDRDDNANAAALLGRALSLVPDDTQLLRDRCEALVSLGDVHAAASVVAELVAVADDDRSRAIADAYDAQLAGQRTPDALRSVAERASAAASVLAAHGDDIGVAHAEAVHASALAGLGQVAACEAALDRSLAAARRAGDNRRANVVLSIAPAAALWGPSPIARASGRCLDVVRVLRITTWAPHVEAHALRHQAVLEAMRDRADAARRMLATARTTFTDLGHRLGLLETSMYEGLVELLDGRPGDAEAPLRSAVAGFEAMGARGSAARASALLARALLEQDRVDEAGALADPTVAGDDLKASIGLLGVAAEVCARRGEVAEALALAGRAVALAEPTDALVDHADARLALARVLAAAGRADDAAAELARARALYDQKGATVGVRRTGEVQETQKTVDRTSVQRRVVENAALRAIRRRTATRVAPDRRSAFRAIFSDDAVVVDHSGGVEVSADEFVDAVNLRAHAVRDVIDPVAALGERHAVVRSVLTFADDPDVGEFDVDRLLVVRARAGDVIDRLEQLSPDDLDVALSRLVELWGEGEAEASDAARAPGIADVLTVWSTVTAQDWEHFGALVSADFEYVDHRAGGLSTRRGRTDMVEFSRAFAEMMDEVELRFDDVLALTPEVLLMRERLLGRRDGGVVDVPTYIVIRFGPDGRAARSDQFDVDDLDAAWACFDRYDRRAPARRVAPNLATAQHDRWAAAITARDLDAAIATYAPELVVRDHVLQVEFGLDQQADSDRRFWTVRDLQVLSEPIAALGERHVLLRSLLRFADGAEWTRLAVRRAASDGRLALIESFPSDDLAAAIACLASRWAEDEAPESERAATFARAVVASAAAFASRSRDVGKWGYADDIRLVDRRTNEIEVAGCDAVIAYWLSLSDAAGGAATARPTDVLALTERAFLFRWETSSVDADGTPFAIPSLMTVRFDRTGLADRIAAFRPEDIDDAWACFDRFDSPPMPTRRVVPNGVTDWCERLIDALQLRDRDATASLYAPGYTRRHNDMAAESDRDAQAIGIDMVVDGDADVSNEPLATLGMHHGLSRITMRWPTQDGAAGDTELVRLYVGVVDDLGRSTRAESFRADDIGSALACLYELWAEDELTDAHEKERARRIASIFRRADTILRGDWDALADNYAAELVATEHGVLPGESVQITGRDAMVEWSRSLVRQSAQLSLGYTDVLALTPKRMLTRWEVHGVSDAGEEFDSARLIATRLDGDGRVDLMHVFDVEDVEAAWVAYDALEERPSRRRVPPNLATAAADRLVRAFAARDAEALADLYDPSFVSHHADLRAAVPRADHLATQRSLLDAGAKLDVELLATLGQRHGLARTTFRWTDERGVVIERTRLYVTRVGDDGRFCRFDTFDMDALSEAVACLRERWAEDEATPTERDRALAYSRAGRAFDAGDWSALAPDAMVVDHRVVGPGVLRGAQTIATSLERASTGQSTQRRMVDVLAVGAASTVVETIVRGMQEGSSFERSALVVAAADERGRFSRIEQFEPDQVDEALACFDRLSLPPTRRRVRPNLATAARDRWAEALRSGDVDELRSLTSDAFVLSHPRMRLELTRDEHFARVGRRGPATVVLEHLATLGERHALHRALITWAGAEAEVLSVTRTDVGGLFLRHDDFEVERLADALACLRERWAEDEAPPELRERALGTARSTRGYDIVDARDWPRLEALLAPDAVMIDDRVPGLGQHRGSKAIVEALARVAEETASHSRIVDVLAATPFSTAFELLLTGVTGGAAHETSLLVVTNTDALGRIQHIEHFEPDRLEESLACFDRLTAAPRRRVTPNAASRVVDAWLAGARSGAIDETRARRAPEFQYVDHEHQLTLDAEGQARREGNRTPDAIWGELVTTLGDRHALHRVHVEHTDPHGAKIAFDLLLVTRVGADGLITLQESFASDDVMHALGCLSERYAEDEARPSERAFWMQVAANSSFYDHVNAHRWDEARALLAPDATFVDHQPVPVPGATSADGIIEWLQAATSLNETTKLEVIDVLAVDTDRQVSMVHTRVSGTTYGAAFSQDGLGVISYDENGRIRSTDGFGMEQADEAWELFDSSAASRRRVMPNRAWDAVCRRSDAVRRRDLAALEAVYGPDAVFVDRHGQTTHTRAAQLRTMGQLFAEPVEITDELIATLGDRVALVRATFVWGADDARNEVASLAVFVVDDDGRIVRNEGFAHDELAPAVGCLYERWRAVEGAPAVTGVYDARRIARETGDWGPLRAAYTDDVVLIDRRTGGPRLYGPDALVEWRRSIDGVADESGTRVVDVLGVRPDATMLEVEISGVRDGGAFAQRSINVAHTAPDGRVRRVEIFPVEAVDDAWALYDSLAVVEVRHDVKNAAMRAGERWFEAIRRGDVDAAAACFTDDMVAVDRRLGHRLEQVGVDTRRRSDEWTIGAGVEDFRAIPIATRGDRLVLGDITCVFSSGAENRMLTLTEVDESLDRMSFIGEWDVEGLSAALAELDSRFVAIEPNAAIGLDTIRRFEDGCRARDRVLATSGFTDDAMIVDHRQHGFPTGDAGAYYDRTISTVDLCETFDGVVAEIPRVEPWGLIAKLELKGRTNDGADFTVQRWNVFTYRGDKVCQLDGFEIEDRVVAEACLDAARPGVAKLLERWRAAFIRADRGAIDALLDSAIVDIDHRPLVGHIRVGAAASSENVDAILASGFRDVRLRTIEHVAAELGLFEITFEIGGSVLCLFECDRAGEHFVRVETFEPDDLDRARRAFELHPVVRVARAWGDAIVHGDVEGATALVTEDFVADDRRPIVGTGVAIGVDRARESHRALIAAGVTRFSSVPVRRVSDRVALTRATYGMPDGSEVSSLSVNRLDLALERLELAIVFDIDDLDAALAELEDLAADSLDVETRLDLELDADSRLRSNTTFDPDEILAAEDLTRARAAALAFVDAFNARDLDAVRAAFTPDGHVLDRRLVAALHDADLDTYVRYVETLFAQSSDSVMRVVEWVADAPGALWLRFVVHTELDERAFDCVLRIEDDRVASLLAFDLGDARAPAHWWALGMTEAHNAHEAARFRSFFADDAVVVNHRLGAYGVVDPDGYLDVLRELWARDATARTTVEDASEATRLLHVVTELDGGITYDSLVVAAADGDERIARFEIFDIDQRADADACFQRLSRATYRNAASRWVERWMEASRAANADEIADLYGAKVEWVERRVALGQPTLERAGAIANNLVIAGMMDGFLEGWVEPIDGRGERLSLFRMVNRLPDGVEVEVLGVVDVDDDERLRRLVVFDRDADTAAHDELERRAAELAVDEGRPSVP